MYTWVPNATGIAISFPAYVYSMYTTYDFVYTGVDDLLYTYYHLAPIDLVPGSNVIIVPQTGPVNGQYVYVYNITSTI